jgi:protein-disulfide isomerase
MEVVNGNERPRTFAVLWVVLAFGLGLGSGFLVWGREVKPTPTTQAAQQQVTPQGPVQRYDVPVDDDPAIGPADAPITLIEFSDYVCPFCGRWYQEVFKKIRAEYPDKVRIVYRDFPLYSIHPDAQPAAEAANCANEQGAYWEYHDKLFTGGKFGKEVYLQYAQELGLDLQKFQDCIESGKYASEIQADYQFASGLGVRSTPTFFLNGIAIVGAQPWEVFKQVIDQELAGEIP